MTEIKLFKRAMQIPNWVIVTVSVIWIFALIYYIYQSGGPKTTFILVILGFFLFLTFSTISFFLIKNQLPFGTYASLSIASLLLVIQTLNFEYRLDMVFHKIITFGIITSLLIIALFKLWDLLSGEIDY